MNKPILEHCGKNHFEECILRKGPYFRCGSTDYYIKDYPNKVKVGWDQVKKPVTTPQRGRRPVTSRSANVNRGGMRDTPVRFEAPTPTRAYAICAREKANALDIIAGTFSLFDIPVHALVDLGSTYSYICTSLVAKRNIPIKLTEFVVWLTNLLG